MHHLKKNIILTGFMGTGKTTVGVELSIRLNMQLIDVDSEIVAQAGMPITEIFDKLGEKKFRDMETAQCLRLSKLNNVIISTGGGVVLRKENMDYFRKNGIIICLTATPETIYKRVETDCGRPLLNSDNLLEKIERLLSERKSFYQNADMTINTDNKIPLEIAWEIIETLHEGSAFFIPQRDSSWGSETL
ncbi:MAG: shikimate kinase [Nitrospirae bacterium]|nr:shikimate kinase [Nitrospirota bacterium]MBF0540444.1 shikimate kinase [Nitrospirota bacterium]